MSKFFTYVIISEKTGKLYKGHCQDLDKRLKQHNAGATKSITSGIPWRLQYYEEFKNRNEAVRRERYFKTAAGRRFLKSKLAP